MKLMQKLKIKIKDVDGQYKKINSRVIHHNTC